MFSGSVVSAGDSERGQVASTTGTGSGISGRYCSCSSYCSAAVLASTDPTGVKDDCAIATGVGIGPGTRFPVARGSTVPPVMGRDIAPSELITVGEAAKSRFHAIWSCLDGVMIIFLSP